MPAQITRAKTGDAAEITKLAREAFWDTFSPFNQASDMNLYMDQAFYEEKQRSEIEAPNIHTYLVRGQGPLAGFFMLIEDKTSIELSRFYFLKSTHGSGLAHEAMKYCLDYSKGLGFKKIWLGVWEENHRAKKFYEKWNFKTVGSHIFQLGNDPQNDLILERDLS